MKDKLHKAEQKLKKEIMENTQISLLEELKQLNANKKTVTGLTVEEKTELEELLKWSPLTKVQLAAKLGLKVNTLAYKIKMLTLSQEEARAIVKAIVEALGGF